MKKKWKGEKKSISWFVNAHKCQQVWSSVKGKCRWCICAVREDRLPAGTLKVKLKLKSCWNPLSAATLQVLDVWFKAGNLPATFLKARNVWVQKYLHFMLAHEHLALYISWLCTLGGVVASKLTSFCYQELPWCNRTKLPL